MAFSRYSITGTSRFGSERLASEDYTDRNTTAELLANMTNGRSIR
jgi:hypothetical protein